MIKSGYNYLIVTKTENIRLTNIATITIANYGNTIVTVFDRQLQPYDKNFGAEKFVIEGDGTYSDLDFTINFLKHLFIPPLPELDSNGFPMPIQNINNKVIIDYREVILKPNCH